MMPEVSFFVYYFEQIDQNSISSLLKIILKQIRNLKVCFLLLNFFLQSGRKGLEYCFHIGECSKIF